MNGGREIELVAGSVRLTFAPAGDRYAHGVWLAAGDGWRLVLRSREGTPEEDWPPSPPLQSLEREQRGASALALSVGMAGKSHWSASFEALVEEGSIWCDVACRVRSGADGRLGSRYELAAGAVVERTEPTQVELAVAAAAERLVLTLEAAEPNGRLSVAHDVVCIEPQTAGGAAGPQTLRWRYRLAAACAAQPSGSWRG